MTNSVIKKWGCFNRENVELIEVQDGYADVVLPGGAADYLSIPRRISIPNVMSKDCKHTLIEPIDPRCCGCNHQKVEA